MFAKGLKVETDLNCGTSELDTSISKSFKGMQSKGVIIGLSTFTKKEIIGVCEACQFRKQHR